MVTKAFLSRTRIGVNFSDLKETVEWEVTVTKEQQSSTFLLGPDKCSVSAVILEEDTSP